MTEFNYTRARRTAVFKFRVEINQKRAGSKKISEKKDMEKISRAKRRGRAGETEST